MINTEIKQPIVNQVTGLNKKIEDETVTRDSFTESMTDISNYQYEQYQQELKKSKELRRVYKKRKRKKKKSLKKKKSSPFNDQNSVEIFVEKIQRKVPNSYIYESPNSPTEEGEKTVGAYKSALSVPKMFSFTEEVKGILNPHLQNEVGGNSDFAKKLKLRISVPSFRELKEDFGNRNWGFMKKNSLKSKSKSKSTSSMSELKENDNKNWNFLKKRTKRKNSKSTPSMSELKEKVENKNWNLVKKKTEEKFAKSYSNMRELKEIDNNWGFLKKKKITFYIGSPTNKSSTEKRKKSKSPTNKSSTEKKRKSKTLFKGFANHAAKSVQSTTKNTLKEKVQFVKESVIKESFKQGKRDVFFLPDIWKEKNFVLPSRFKDSNEKIQKKKERKVPWTKIKSSLYKKSKHKVNSDQSLFNNGNRRREKYKRSNSAPYWLKNKR